MSIKTMTRVWETANARGNRLLMLLALADHADDDGICWPGIERLAVKTRLTARQVQRILRSLGESYTTYIGRCKGGRSKTNLYFVTCGLDQSSLVSILMRRFGKDRQEADRIAEQIILENPGVHVTVSKNEKGDILGQKGDILGQKGDIAMSPDPSLEPSCNHHAPLPKNGNGGMSLSQSELPDVQTQVGILFAGSSATIRQAEMDIKRASWRISSDDLRLAAAHFMTASGLDVPYDKMKRKSWLTGLREHLDTFGLDFIKKNYPKVVIDMRNKGLSVVQPQSVTSFLLDLKARGKSPANIITENGKKVRVVK